VKKSLFFGGLFRPDFLILGIAIILGLLLVGGTTPFNFKNTPSDNSQYVVSPVGPENKDSTLQLKKINFKKIIKDCTRTTAVDFVLDRSGTMGARQDGGSKIKLEYLKDGVSGFITLMSDESLIGVQSFGNNATLDFPIDLLKGKNDSIISKIRSYKSGGNTPMKGALEIARNELTTAKQKFNGYSFSLILLSDGMWNTGGDPTSVVNEIKAMGIKIYTIAYGNKSIVNFMKQSASSPSDSFYSPGNQDIEKILDQIQAKICK